MSTISRLVMQAFYRWRYFTGKTPWDTNVTPPEVVELVEGEQFPQTRPPKPRALDIGCGTGTNAIYLAQRGFTVVGLDFVPHAIESARQKSRSQNLSIDFRAADILGPLNLPAPFDLILDIGCFHSIDASGRARYAANIAQWTKPGSLFMVYAFFPHQLLGRTIGMTRADMEHLFNATFTLRGYADDGKSAWYRWERK